MTLRRPLSLLALLGLFAAGPGAGGAEGQVAPPTGADRRGGDMAGEGARLPLPARVEAVTSASPMDRVHWGVLLYDPVSGDTLYSRNPQLPFVPASNMKIPVTYGAMALLGPEWRWDTAFWTRTGVRPDTRGTLDGDLVLVGTGDPTLGAPFHASAEAALGSLAATLVASGVRRIEGQLVVDVAAWDSTTVPSAWMVGNLGSRFAATGGAFTVGAGEIDFEIVGGLRPGDPARLGWTPMGWSDFVENRVVTGGAASGTDIRAHFLPEARRWIVEGAVAPQARVTRTHAVRDPVGHSVAALERALMAAGVEVRGGVRIAWDRDEPLLGGCAAGRVDRCPEAERVAGLPSPPLAEVVRAIMEPSQNWMTEQLVRTLGAELGREGSWNAGFEVLTTFLVDEVGVDPVELHWRDGSGLSAYNLISPRALVRILDDARTRPWFAQYRAAQAEPGRNDSTLRTRLAPLAGRVHAKTGSISHVNALSGYLVRDDGREVIFSILTNTGNLPAAQVREAMDLLVLEFSRP